MLPFRRAARRAGASWGPCRRNGGTSLQALRFGQRLHIPVLFSHGPASSVKGCPPPWRRWVTPCRAPPRRTIASSAELAERSGAQIHLEQLTTCRSWRGSERPAHVPGRAAASGQVLAAAPGGPPGGAGTVHPGGAPGGLEARVDRALRPAGDAAEARDLCCRRADAGPHGRAGCPSVGAAEGGCPRPSWSATTTSSSPPPAVRPGDPRDPAPGPGDAGAGTSSTRWSRPGAARRSTGSTSGTWRRPPGGETRSGGQAGRRWPACGRRRVNWWRPRSPPAEAGHAPCAGCRRPPGRR